MANYRVMLSEHLVEPALKNVYNGPNGIEFSWKPISNADGYIIYRKEGNGGWKRLATLSGTSKSSYVDKALKAGAKYTYTVKAYKGDAYSYYSEAGLPIVRLSKAGITGLYPVSNGVRITWHKTTGAAGYMVYRSTGNGVFTKIATVKGYDSVSYIDKTDSDAKTLSPNVTIPSYKHGITSLPVISIHPHLSLAPTTTAKPSLKSYAIL